MFEFRYRVSDGYIFEINTDLKTFGRMKPREGETVSTTTQEFPEVPFDSAYFEGGLVFFVPPSVAPLKPPSIKMLYDLESRVAQLEGSEPQWP